MTSSLRSRFAISLHWLSLVSTCWVMMANVASAAEKADESKGWVTSYFLVGLCIFLGLIVVLRPVGRTTEVKKAKED